MTNKNYFICAKKLKSNLYQVVNIFETFSDVNLKSLKNLPKIYLMDCCRVQTQSDIDTKLKNNNFYFI